jgi:hypothetical protein
MSLKCLLDNHSYFLVYQSSIRKYLFCRKLPSLMPGSGHAHSNLPLSDTLSARSYLEFGREEFQTQSRLHAGQVHACSLVNDHRSTKSRRRRKEPQATRTRLVRTIDQCEKEAGRESRPKRMRLQLK